MKCFVYSDLNKQPIILKQWKPWSHQSLHAQNVSDSAPFLKSKDQFINLKLYL